ncbi:hypothetical protein HY612_02940 [Candidatus Roizmanbacteria bacterium]|nr:hypothetical protein [Candidatus Roizmanbacteria bacterium]
MKKLLLGTILIISFFLFSASLVGQIHAAFLNFDKATVLTSLEEAFEIQVIVDGGSDQISSTDAYIIYDASLLEAQAITPGNFFPTVVNNITSGKVYIAGLVDNPATYKTGSGTVATITFKALSQGSGTLSFDCQEGVYNSSKIIKNDLNATNIIDCNQNGTSSMTVGSSLTGGKIASPSALPKSGIFENFSKVAVPGMILLLLGGALRIIL